MLYQSTSGHSIGGGIAVTRKNLSDANRRVTVPQWNWAILLSVPVQRLRELFTEQSPVKSDQDVGSTGDCYRPLRILAQREARCSQVGRLLLNPARVLEEDPRMFL